VTIIEALQRRGRRRSGRSRGCCATISRGPAELVGEFDWVGADADPVAGLVADQADAVGADDPQPVRVPGFDVQGDDPVRQPHGAAGVEPSDVDVRVAGVDCLPAAVDLRAAGRARRPAGRKA
jgi:hypothetical protein